MSQTAQPSKPTTMQVGTILDDALEPSPLAKLRRRVFRNHSFLIGTLVLLLIFGVALLAPVLAPHDPYEQELSSRLMNPTWQAIPRQRKPRARRRARRPPF